MFNIRRPFKLLNLSIDTPKCRSHSIKLSNTIYSSSKISEEERLLFENTQLQFQIHQKEEEIKMYKIKLNQCQPKIGLNIDNAQQKQNVKKLQIYIKQLELDLLQKSKTIEDLKKQMSLTKFQELQIEALAFQQECQKLMKQFSKLNKLLNYKNNGIDLFELYENLENQIKNLENVNKTQVSVIHQLQDEQQKYKNQIEQLELENKNLQRENRKVLQILNQNNTPNQTKLLNRNQFLLEDQEISQLKAKITYLQNQMTKQQNQKEKYIQNLLSIIMDKEDQIQAYEKQKIIIKEVSKPDQQTLDSKYQQCIQHIKSEYSIYEDILIDIPPQLSLIKQISMRKKQNASDLQKSQYLELNSQIDEEPYSRNLDQDDSIVENEYRTKKLPKINTYEVQIIGRKLKFELQTKLIPLNYLDQIFDCTDQEYQDITVEEIILILSAEPFMMVDEKERLLVARYLIEDNTQDYVLHNLLNSNSITIIKSVFKQLLGKYQLFSKQEKQNIEQQLKDIFLRFQYKILDSLQQQCNVKNNNQKVKECSLADFEAILKSCEIALLPRQMEYLNLINFSFCKQIEILHYSELLDYFCNVKSL
ncbi:unnamed protein product [Paramecium pentaurelia]|uniref:Uncharacterized protein n=1 Tax=Paramecium pentaurelia TaxID=43138 RepID=A0A8S1YBK0_9CILI|nr:unnamed protein product [Paramecium pentaurelia]